VQVVRLAHEMGLVKLGTIAVDGTKVKANASRHKAMSYGHMLKAEAELKAQIEALLNKARAADEAEKNEPELDIPAEIERRQDRLDAIAAARTRLEQRQRDADLERGRSDDDDHKPRGQDGKPKPGGRYKRPFGVPQDKDQDNFTDPDSRIMQRAGGGFDPAYNGQTAVDDTAHIIVAAELINNASDVRELPTMLQAVKSALGAYPEQTLADAGYRSEEVFEVLAGRTDLVVAIGREGKSHRPINEASLPLTAAMVTKMKTQDARAAYRRRKWLAEPPNGWIKNVLGFRQFQHAWSAPGASRVETRVHGVESAADGDDAVGLKACHSPRRHLARFAAWSSRPQPAPRGAPIAQTTPSRLHCLHQTGNKASAAHTPSAKRRLTRL
jgi:hypothetical protein